jgi:hypothetical protein
MKEKPFREVADQEHDRSSATSSWKKIGVQGKHLDPHEKRSGVMGNKSIQIVVWMECVRVK